MDGGHYPYPYRWLDALTQKVREDGRIVNVSVAVATGVNREGKREVLGIDVGTSEDGQYALHTPLPRLQQSVQCSDVVRRFELHSVRY